jgi:hypothetical protein
MGDVLFHSESSAKTFGGIAEDYAPIHKYMDDTKMLIADWRHRLLRHNSAFIDESERIFGIFWTRQSDGKKVSTRSIVTQHIIEDLGFVPSLADWLRELPLKNWMNGATSEQRRQFQTLTIDAPGHTLDWVPAKVFWQPIKVTPKKPGLYLIARDGEPCETAVFTLPSNWMATSAPTTPILDILYWAELPPTPVGENHPH